MYHANLGAFIERFARCESNLHDFVGWLAELDEPTALALLSGSKVDADISFVRRLYEFRDQTIPPPLDKALIQLGHINTVRNQILHNETYHWIRFAEDETVAEGRSNSNYNRKPRSPTEIDLTAEFLGRLSEDVSRVDGVITSYFHTVSYSNWTEAEFYEDFLTRHTWRCKLPLPVTARPKSQQRSRKSQDPPQSSEA